MVLSHALKCYNPDPGGIDPGVLRAFKDHGYNMHLTSESNTLAHVLARSARNYTDATSWEIKLFYLRQAEINPFAKNNVRETALNIVQQDLHNNPDHVVLPTAQRLLQEWEQEVRNRLRDNREAPPAYS